MRTRCKHGGLAMIVKEEPGCEGNLGRFVRVFGPSLDEVGVVWWRIEPVTATRWDFGGRPHFVEVPGMPPQYLEQPDSWMLPIRQPKRRRGRASSTTSGKRGHR